MNQPEGSETLMTRMWCVPSRTLVLSTPNRRHLGRQPGNPVIAKWVLFAPLWLCEFSWEKSKAQLAYILGIFNAANSIPLMKSRCHQLKITKTCWESPVTISQQTTLVILNFPKGPIFVHLICCLSFSNSMPTPIRPKPAPEQLELVVKSFPKRQTPGTRRTLELLPPKHHESVEDKTLGPPQVNLILVVSNVCSNMHFLQ